MKLWILESRGCRLNCKSFRVAIVEFGPLLNGPVYSFSLSEVFEKIGCILVFLSFKIVRVFIEVIYSMGISVYILF